MEWWKANNVEGGSKFDERGCSQIKGRRKRMRRKRRMRTRGSR